MSSEPLPPDLAAALAPCFFCLPYERKHDVVIKNIPLCVQHAEEMIEFVIGRKDGER